MGPATPSSLRLTPCDLPKIDGNVAYMSLSTVSYRASWKGLTGVASLLIDHDQISTRARQHASRFTGSAAHDFCKRRMDVDEIYE